MFFARNEQIEREDKEKIEADMKERKRKVMSYQGMLHKIFVSLLV